MADKKVDSEGYVYKKEWLSGEYRRKENFWGQQERKTDFFGQPKKGRRAETWWGGDVKSEKGCQIAEMPFEKGHLFWLGQIDGYGDISLVIATFGGQNEGDTGAWLTQPETWNGEGICGVSLAPRGIVFAG